MMLVMSRGRIRNFMLTIEEVFLAHTRMFVRTELVSISKHQILQMTEEEILALMNQATYVKVFTDRTWSKLNDRLDYFRQMGQYEPTRPRQQEIPWSQIPGTRPISTQNAC
jgi:hypothetical protein